MIFSVEHAALRAENLDLYAKVTKHLFQRKYGSLNYASPHILEQLLLSTQGVDEKGELTEVSENKQMYHIKRKVERIIEEQNQAVNSSKMTVYQLIPRWMPYSCPIYIEPIKQVFTRLRDQKEGAAPSHQETQLKPADPLEQVVKGIEQETKDAASPDSPS